MSKENKSGVSYVVDVVILIASIAGVSVAVVVFSIAIVIAVSVVLAK